MWTKKGNLKGSAAPIPSDVMTINQVTCNVVWYMGSRARFTVLTNGVKLELQDTGGAWHLADQWSLTP